MALDEILYKCRLKFVLWPQDRQKGFCDPMLEIFAFYPGRKPVGLDRLFVGDGLFFGDEVETEEGPALPGLSRT